MDEELKDLLKKAEDNLALFQKRAEQAENKVKALEDSIGQKVSSAVATALTESRDKQDEKVSELKQEIADLEERIKSGPVTTATVDSDMVELRRKAIKMGVAQFLKGQSAKGANIDGLRSKSLLGQGVVLQDAIDLELKSLNLTNAGEGLESVEEVLSREIVERAREGYPILGEIAMVGMPRDMRQQVLKSYPSVQQGIENVAGTSISETETQTYAQIKNKIAKVNAKPRITHEALYGSDLDLYAHLLELLDDEVGRWLVSQVLFGDGSEKSMRGILSSTRLDITDTTGESWKPTIHASDARNPDFYPAIGTGVDGDLPGTHQLICDWFIDVETALPTKYLQTAKYYMNRRSLGRIRKVKDSDGNPIFTRDYIDGKAVMTINGFPVFVDDTLPDIASDAPWLIFGDLKQAFRIAPGAINNTLPDPYTVDGCLVIKIDKEYYEMMHKNDAIIIGVATVNDGN